jgi:hypothetical protein
MKGGRLRKRQSALRVQTEIVWDQLKPNESNINVLMNAFVVLSLQISFDALRK